MSSGPESPDQDAGWIRRLTGVVWVHRKGYDGLPEAEDGRDERDEDVDLQEISERGGSLSSGQRQLIALARAEPVDPAILLLDEATANLDLATEAKVSAAMAAVSGRRTTVLIAHRLQTARTADRIVVLGQGRVLEEGGHDELVARGGAYAAMWRAFELVSAS